MNCREFFGHLLAVFVIVGLVAAPLATPAAAKRLSAVSMTDMSGDMPCCPDEQNKNDCSDCPLVAICMLKTAQAQPSASVIVVRLPTRELFFAVVDRIADSLGCAPPEHPPRILV